jgi:hypothetical protein
VVGEEVPFNGPLGRVRERSEDGEDSISRRRSASGRRQCLQHGERRLAGYFIENYTGNVASGTAWTQNDSNRVYVGDISRPYFSEYTDSNSVSIGQWLASGGVNYTGPGAGDPMNNTLWLFYTDNSFSHAPNVTITHDDGVEGRWQNILGPVYSGFTSSGTAPITETGTCPGCTGSGQFGFVYNEAFGGAAVAQVKGFPSRRHG